MTCAHLRGSERMRIFLALALFAGAQAMAQRTLTGAQYRIDGGAAQSMTLTAGAEFAYPNPSPPPATLRASKEYTARAAGLSVNNLTLGPHLAEVRATDSAAVATSWRGRWFYVAGTKSLAGAEWYLDTAPAPGSGHAIATPADGAWDEAEEAISVSGIDTSTLSIGLHTIYVRAKDQDGLWSKPCSATFQVINPPTVVAAEWITDPDTTPGQGTAMTRVAGKSGKAEQDWRWSGVPPEAWFASTGSSHLKIYTRFKDSYGVWSYWRNPSSGPSQIINRAPVADTVTPPVGALTFKAGEIATFTVSNTRDPDGDTFTQAWLLDNISAGSGQTFTWNTTASNIGPHTVICRLTDDVSTVTGCTQAVVTYAWPVTLEDPPVVTVTPATFSVREGVEQIFNATSNDAQDTAFTWRAAGVASVLLETLDPDSAKITPLTDGTLTVRATGNHSGVVGESQGTIIDTLITVTPTPITAYVGDEVTLTATSTHPGDTLFSWLTNDPGITFLVSTGATTARLTALKAGSTTILVSGSASFKSAQVNVEVTEPPTEVTVTPTPITLEVGAQAVLEATSTNAADTSFAWASTPESTVWLQPLEADTVRVTARTPGAATVVATGSSSGVGGEAAITVNATPVSVDPAEAEVPQDLSMALAASSTDAQDATLGFSWRSLDTTVATVALATKTGESARVTGVKAGGVTFIVVTGGHSGKCAVTRVAVGDPIVISITGAAQSLLEGAGATATASSNDPQDATSGFTWSSDDPAIVTVEALDATRAQLTGVSVGETQIRATGGHSGVSGAIGVKVAPNVAFSSAAYGFTLDLAEDQAGYVRVVNGGPNPHQVRVDLAGTVPQGLLLGFVGNGSADTGAVTMPGQSSLDVQLLVHAAEAYAAVHTLTAQLHITDVAQDALPTASIRLRLRGEDRGLVFEEVEEEYDPASLSHLVRVTNTGAAISDLRVFGDDGISDCTVFEPNVSHAQLAPGEVLDVRVTPDLSLVALKRNVAGYVYAWANGGLIQQALAVDFSCAQVVTETLYSRLLVVKMADRYGTNRGAFTLPFALPRGFSAEDIDSAALLVSFTPRCGWAQAAESMRLAINDTEVGVIDNAVPRGVHRFTVPLAPNPFVLPGLGVASNEVRVTPERDESANPAHLLEVSEATLVLALSQVAAAHCGYAKAEAFSLFPAEPAVISFDVLGGDGQPLADCAAIQMGTPYTIEAMFDPADANLAAVAFPNNGEPGLTLAWQPARSLYTGSWKPREPSTLTGGTCTLTLATGGTLAEATRCVTLVDSGPVADFEANPVRGRVPLAVAFSDRSVGAPAMWQWTFGDGETSGEQHPVHVYAAPGTYSVSLEVDGASTELKNDYIVVSGLAHDINVDGASDALDVQLVINAVLGISIPYEADVNGDGAVDALDVQLVINAALGIA